MRSVRGERFGSVAGPWFASWSEPSRVFLDGIIEPRPLTGDLSIGNEMHPRVRLRPVVVG